MSRFAVILPAAGQSSRFQGKEKKPFTNLDGRPVWIRTAELFVTREDVGQCIILISPEDVETFKLRNHAHLAFLNIEIVEGGKERFESVANAIAKIKDDIEFIAVHDAVRPCITSEHIDAVFKKASETGAAMLGTPVHSTLKKVNKDKEIIETVPREHLWLAQTPQVFRKDWLIEAYDKRDSIEEGITDDAQLIEAIGHSVHIVEGESTNVKITTKQDLALAEAILKARPSSKPSGPSHPFAEDAMW